MPPNLGGYLITHETEQMSFVECDDMVQDLDVSASVRHDDNVTARLLIQTAAKRAGRHRIPGLAYRRTNAGALEYR
jgi:hypothetical protein